MLNGILKDSVFYFLIGEGSTLFYWRFNVEQYFSEWQWQAARRLISPLGVGISFLPQ